MYGNITITIEGEVQSTEGTGAVELGEVYLGGEVGGAPVAL